LGDRAKIAEDLAASAGLTRAGLAGDFFIIPSLLDINGLSGPVDANRLCALNVYNRKQNGFVRNAQQYQPLL
jgi:hypothetical protein